MNWKQIVRWLKITGSIAGALTAIGALWITLGFPTIATSSDIKRLDRQQADTAIDIYQTKLRSLLVVSPSTGTAAYKAWEEELNQARDQLKRAEDRKIDLSK